MNGDLWVLVGLVLLMAGLLHFLPTWRRRGLWFGVTVAPAFSESPEGRSALRRYRLAAWIASLVAISCAVLAQRLPEPALAPLGLLVQAVGASVAFAVVRHRVLPFGVRDSGRRSVAVSADPEGLPGGAASAVVPLGMLAATSAYLHANWQRLPMRVPVHWSFDGTPNGWADRTWHGVYGPLLVCALAGLFLLLMAEGIIHASPRARVAGTEAWTRRFRRANVILLVAGVWGLTAMMCLHSLTPLFGDASRPSALIWLVPIVTVLAILPFTWQLFRVVKDRDSGSDGTPDACWKFGLFYYNPDDAALMVEKRFGIGYTVNFGNRTLWWIVGVAALLVVFFYIAR
jgi:uncharacterized membrane protein